MRFHNLSSLLGCKRHITQICFNFSLPKAVCVRTVKLRYSIRWYISTETRAANNSFFDLNKLRGKTVEKWAPKSLFIFGLF